MKERRKNRKDRREFQTGQNSNWDGFERRKGPRRHEEEDIAVLDYEEYEKKQRLKMERREKERRLKDQRKRGRLKKEMGLN